MDAVQLLVHMRDEQALSSRIGVGEAAGEKVAGVAQRRRFLLNGP
jgi:hypothetical protein